MTTQTKPDGYVVYDFDGIPMYGTNHPTQSGARRLFQKLFTGVWSKYVDQGYTVRPVTITEVKDDE